MTGRRRTTLCGRRWRDGLPTAAHPARGRCVWDSATSPVPVRHLPAHAHGTRLLPHVRQSREHAISVLVVWSRLLLAGVGHLHGRRGVRGVVTLSSRRCDGFVT